MVGNPDYVPRWEKRKERVKCCIKDCTEVSHVFGNIATVEKLVPIFEENYLHTKGDQFQFQPRCVSVTITQSTSQSMQPQQTNCATCGMSLKHVKVDHAQMQK